MAEKLVFLKREEVRTMAKDLARLQETEALAEKEKISRFRTEEKPGKQLFSQAKAGDIPLPPSTMAEPIPAPDAPLPKIRKPSSWQKVFVRILFILLFFAFLALIGFGFWFIFVKNKPEPTPTPSPSATPFVTPTPLLTPTPSFTPEISPSPTISPLVPPIPIFSVKEIKILDISSTDNDLKTGLAKINEEALEPGFFELAIKKNEAFLSPAQLLQELKISYPENLFVAVSDNADDFDFLLYQKTDNIERHALIVRVKSAETLNQVLIGWETLISQNGLSVFDERITTLANTFKTMNYKNTSIRFLTISKNDLGACYGIVNNRLIFATSLEAIKTMIDNILAID